MLCLLLHWTDQYHLSFVLPPPLSLSLSLSHFRTLLLINYPKPSAQPIFIHCRDAMVRNYEHEGREIFKKGRCEALLAWNRGGTNFGCLQTAGERARKKKKKKET
jgi:hypothetical protein